MGGVGTAAAVSSAAAAATAEDAVDAAAGELRLDAEVLALLEALPARWVATCSRPYMCLLDVDVPRRALPHSLCSAGWDVTIT